MGKDDPPYFKSLRPSKTSPNWALHTYLANRWEYPTLWTIFFFHSFIGYSSCNIQYKSIIQNKKKKKKKEKDQKPKRGRCNGTNVLCKAPPLAKSSQSTNKLVVCRYSANVSQSFLSAFFSMSSLMRVKEQRTWHD